MQLVAELLEGQPALGAAPRRRPPRRHLHNQVYTRAIVAKAALSELLPIEARVAAPWAVACCAVHASVQAEALQQKRTLRPLLRRHAARQRKAAGTWPGSRVSASAGLLNAKAARTPASASGQSLRCRASSCAATTCVNGAPHLAALRLWQQTVNPGGAAAHAAVTKPAAHHDWHLPACLSAVSGLTRTDARRALQVLAGSHD